MSDLNKVDTDFQQFNDAAEFRNRRSIDREPMTDCTREECPKVCILERRVDRHRDEINTLTKDLAQNTSDTKEILEIVSKGKNFFAIVDWIGTKVMAIVTFFGLILGIFYIFKDHAK